MKASPWSCQVAEVQPLVGTQDGELCKEGIWQHLAESGVRLPLTWQTPLTSQNLS